jgi:topoisomerase-4 subunit A
MSKNEKIEIVNFKEALSEKYLAYALSTITSRSLPDVRDGLKPVHRRLLWAMHLLKLDPDSGFKKCARVVGDVIGKYHPHGDVAVYDAMVRLAQDFSVRYPLVDGQGNFGSIDGDNAAAMRYTEAKLTDVAMFMLRDIEQNTVDFRPTYDNQDEEPVVLPAYFPNLLANGSEGIAVGMATAIPPHNVEEICDAALQLLKKQSSTNAELLEHIQGPDFPTGGEIVEPKEAIIQAYETGKGSFRLRAKWKVEELSHNQYQIVVFEIPYQVQKSRLLEKMADNLENKKTPLLGNLKDESAETIRIVLEPKNRNVDPEILMESLYRSCDLEIKYNMNLNALDKNGVPKVMSISEVLSAFLEHRKEVLIRKSNYRLEKIETRLEVLGGLLVVYLNLDEVIKIIREEDEPAEVMMKRFKLTKNQVEAILNTRLRSLRKLEEMEIRREDKELKEERKNIKEMLADEKLLKKEISERIKEVRDVFSKKTKLGKRRTVITNKAVSNTVISIDAFIEKEPITIAVSETGWVRGFKGHNIDTSAIKYKEGDAERFILKAQTTDKILLFTTSGRFYTLSADKIPGGKGFGDPIRLMLELADTEEILDIEVYNEKDKYLIASNKGKGFIVEAADVLAQTKQGKQVLNISDKEKALKCIRVEGTHVATLGDNRFMLVFELAEIPTMKRGQGVGLQKFKDANLTDIKVFDMAQGLSWKNGSKNFNLTDLKMWQSKRAGKGRTAPQGISRTNKFE